MLRRGFIYLGLAICGLAGLGAQTDARSIPAGEIGSPVPDFFVRDMAGRKVSSAPLRGKVVLIDFWATWCRPCKKEMPGYQKLLDRYRNHGFAVIGFKLNTMKDTEEPLAFARRIGVNYPLVVATAELTQKFGGIEGLPTTMIYDRKGILRKKIIGFEYTGKVETEIKNLF